MLAPVAPGGQSFTVSITGGPEGDTEQTDAVVTFEATATADFTCSLDGSEAEACGSDASSGSVEYTDLEEGDHVVVVRATEASSDDVGPTDTDERRWSVVPPAPIESVTVTETETETQTETETVTETVTTAEQPTTGDTETAEAVAAGGDDDGDIVWVLLGGLALTLVAAGTALAVRAALRGRRRVEWQRQARDEEPPDDCRVCTRHCRREELTLRPGRRRVAAVELQASHDTWQLSPTLAEALDDAAHRGRDDEVDLLLLGVADRLAGEARVCLLDRGPTTASVSAHLTGGSVECVFTLSHCVRGPDGGVWTVEDEWTAEVADERDAHVLDLPHPVAAPLEPIVARLRVFVGLVDVPAERPPEAPPVPL